MNTATPPRLGRATLLVSAGVVLGVAATRRARRVVRLKQKQYGLHEGLAKLDGLGEHLDALLTRPAPEGLVDA